MTLSKHLLPEGTTIEQCVDWVEQQYQHHDLFFGHGTDNAFDEAAWTVFHAAGLMMADEEPDWELSLTQSQLDQISALVDERTVTRQPLAYIIKQAWFAGLSFYVDSRAIVPRSHIGEWIEDGFFPWLDIANVHHVADLCTGGGCIAVALAKAIPHARVYASDLSSNALQVAQINIDQHEVGERVNLLHGDLFQPLTGIRCDLIVCNPPYVDNATMAQLPDEYRDEPDMAFRGGHDGLEIIVKLLRQARDYLSDKGVLVVEAGSAKASMLELYENIPFTWLMSANTESVVFLITVAELEKYADQW